MTWWMRLRSSLMTLRSLPESARLKPLLRATCSERASSASPCGTGTVKRPALVSCHTYWLPDPFCGQAGLAPAGGATVQVVGLGPALLLQSKPEDVRRSALD